MDPSDGEVPVTELFLDERGSLLRASWDEARRRLVVSIWRDGTCVATHRLDGADAARLAALLGSDVAVGG